MKILLINKTPILISGRICKFLGNVLMGQTAMAITFPPFIILSNYEMLENKNLIRHETVHLRQYLETLILPVLIVSIFENLYARLVLKKSALDAYYFMALEQEAHQNDEDVDYLKNRKWFSYYKFILRKNKVKITYVNKTRTVYKNNRYT